MEPGEETAARSADRDLEVRPDLVIPESEIAVRRTRSGGPGGQNVNKVATRVELCFDIAASSVLSEHEKQQLRARLRGRTSRDGVLRVVSQRHRSQARNETEARLRLAELLAAALHSPEPRRPTRPSRASRSRRLEAKRRRGDIKRGRAPRATDG